MDNGIEDYKYKKCYETCETCLGQAGFKLGFDAAMELQLPVLFALFCERTPISNGMPTVEYIYKGHQYSTKELYDYWLKNVYENGK